ncbi:MAG: hypothetical protein IPL39_00320 [Opitutaceae bacterium]|nr:hypothetical protein [Opitutaceae bacterium]
MIVEARRLLEELAKHDSANYRWSIAVLNARLKEAQLVWKQGNSFLAAQLTTDVRPQLERLTANEPTSRSFAFWLAKTLLFDARMRAGTDPAVAMALAQRAVEVSEALVLDNRTTNAEVGECAHAWVLAGEIAAQTGDLALARVRWQRAVDLIGLRMQGSLHWRLLDPAARAVAALGRIDEARLIAERLHKIGYVPLEPWPSAITPGAPESMP